jgi:RNA polymerase sigma-70 factor (ECF subfamily)
MGHADGTIDVRVAMMDCRPVADWHGSESMDEVSAVRAAQEGDTRAFGSLYMRYAKMVHGILLARVPYAEVEDLVQDVFLQALPRLKALRDLRRFGGWLAAITRNRAIDYHRQAHTVAGSAKFVAEDGVEVLESATPVGGLHAETVLETIRTLPETYRETLILRLVEGMTGPEIAARTGLTPGSVRVNLHRGMQQLREKLGNPASQAVPNFGMQSSLAAKWKFVMRKRNAP